MQFDKSLTFKNKVEPIIQKLIETCKNNNIPIFISAAISDNDKETTYHTQFCSPAAMEQKLTDDNISKHILVSRGFSVHAFPSEIENCTVLNDEFICDSPLYEELDGE